MRPADFWELTPVEFMRIHEAKIPPDPNAPLLSDEQVIEFAKELS